MCVKNNGEDYVKENCPITDIKFIEPRYRTSYEYSGYTVIDFIDDRILLAFSKMFESLPPTTLKIGEQPCANPYETGSRGTSYPTDMNPRMCSA